MFVTEVLKLVMTLTVLLYTHQIMMCTAYVSMIFHSVCIKKSALCVLRKEFSVLCILRLKNQRTNGPVNAHLRSAVYTNVIKNSPSIGADEALGPFFFFQNNQ